MRTNKTVGKIRAASLMMKTEQHRKELVKTNPEGAKRAEALQKWLAQNVK